ncbi:MAG: amidohydrolase family protein [Actinomycetota bacterium]|nr:amidohydrolase family protein [Actinomycetota bacterium]
MTSTLYLGGRVRTASGAWVDAVLVDGGLIGWLGSAAEARELSADHRVDAGGSLLTPAFVDAHVHATAAGLALSGLDLRQTASASAALELVEQHARQTRGRPILGHGWDETVWPEGRPPTRQELDRASYGGVVYLSRVDSHSALASSALLASVPDARALTGFAESGWLRQEAHHAVRRAVRDKLPPAQRAAAQRATMQAAAAAGIGCLHEMAGPDISGADDLRSLLDLAGEEAGPEVIAYWGELGGAETARELGAVGAAGDLFVDGAIGSHTAYLSHDYTDVPTRGALYVDSRELTEHIVACGRAGLQAGFHAIGDAALAVLLDNSFPAAAAELGVAQLVAGRHRIEHAEMADERCIRRMAEYGIVASVQPAFDAAWGGRDGMYERRLGAERARSTNPFAAMAAAGVEMALGSDAPVTPLDPWGAVRAAAHHQSPGSALSVEAAFDAHTSGGWRAAGCEPGEGQLAVGRPATFAVWRAGPAGWAGSLPDLSPGAPAPACLRTVVRGRIIHDVEGALG